MRILLSTGVVFIASLFVTSNSFGQVFFRPFEVVLDDDNPSIVSRPGEVIPGTEDVVIAPGVNLDGFDLRGAELNDIPDGSFVSANLFRSDLGNLPGPDFHDAILDGGFLTDSFEDADFINASMESTWLDDSGNFSNANFSGANLTNSSLRFNATFQSARFDEANLQQAQLNGLFLDASFANAVLDQTVLSGNFARADFTGVDFSSSDLTHGNFQYAVFAHANFGGDRDAILPEQLRGVDAFLGADFSYANFSGRAIGQAGFTNASFRGANLSDVRFDNDVRFFANDFRQANLDNASFKGSNLILSDVRQVDFTRMRSFNVGLVGSTYDQFTVFPDDFDPGTESMEYLPAILGDTDLDDEIAFADFLILSANFGSACEDTDLECWQRGDFDLDGVVTFADFLTQSEGFKTTDTASVPEPTSNVVLVVCVLTAVFFVRRYDPSQVLQKDEASRH